MFRYLALLCLCVAIMPAQTSGPAADPAYATLAKAFDALRDLDYDTAIPLFRKAAALAPGRTDIRKNLAYTLLKTGENEQARQAFGDAMRIDPADLHVALEYAFLCYEAKDNAPARKAEARRIFLTVKDTSADAELRQTAARAFTGIDEPLTASIARWKQALATSTPNFSAHFELAQLAEQRDELDLAAAQYTAAYRLLPERKSVLLDLARAEKARGNTEGEMAALLAASRGSEPRAAELAKEQLPARYPFVYEFRKALELDPKNNTLHRELAYLLLSMSQPQAEVDREFQAVVEASPEDYLAIAQLGLLYLADQHEDRAMPLLKIVLAKGSPATANRVRMALHMPLVLEDRGSAEAPLDPRVLGERSYNAGFMKDALRYFTQAHEMNPIDSAVILKLGWVDNMLHDDRGALQWFRIARQSADPAIAAEARKAYTNLAPGQQRARTTLWMYPLYSSRWSDLFGYGQLKTELRFHKLPLHPYMSIRFVGDARRTTPSPYGAQSLSESAFIMGAGIATSSWRGAMGWFEVGTAKSYLNGTGWRDVRGGVSYSRTYGASLAAEHSGWFLETTGDSVYISHFSNDLINYSQNRLGYTIAKGGLRAQPFWTNNITFDVKRQYWANFTDMGPGLRIHPPGTPPALAITVSAIRGIYLNNEGNPRRPNFNDIRIGVWYAFTK